MFSFTVAGKEYKVRFGYKVLCSTDLIDRVANISNHNGDEHPIQNIMSTIAELLLAGLQKNHEDEFGWTTESEKEQALNKVYDLLDSYEDESTPDDSHDGFTMFTMLNEELMKNGFLSKTQQLTEEGIRKKNVASLPKTQKKA